jgi:hypothetical protein
LLDQSIQSSGSHGNQIIAMPLPHMCGNVNMPYYSPPHSPLLRPNQNSYDLNLNIFLQLIL